LTRNVKLGDVVVVTVTVEHDFRERFAPEPLPRHAGNHQRLDELRTVADATAFPFIVHFGPVASGDEDTSTACARPRSRRRPRRCARHGKELVAPELRGSAVCPSSRSGRSAMPRIATRQPRFATM
jgi:hypothetical protein